MKVFKLIVITAFAAAALSSCGLFKKDCGCPHFGMRKTVVNIHRA